MPDDRYKTTLEIGVDDKEVRRLGETIHRALETEPIMRFRRSIEELTAQIARMNVETQRAAGIPPSGPSAPRPPGMLPIPQPPQRGAAGAPSGTYRDANGRLRENETGRFVGGAGGGGAGGGGGGFFRQAAATGVGVMGAQALQRMMGAGPAMARGQGAVGAAMGAIPIFGPYMEAALSAAQGLAGQYGAFGQQLAPMGGMAGIGRIGPEATRRAAGFGIAKPQLAQQIGPLAQQLGMRGGGTAETVSRLLGIERVTGIQAGQMAGVVGAGGVAGQAATQAGAIGQIGDIISAGIESGMRKQKLGDFMSEITSHVTALRRQGILIEPRSLGAFIAGVSKYGAAFKGEAGTQAAGNILGAMRGAGERNDFGAMLIMQTAMEQGRDPYEAMEALEDPEQAREILPAIIEKIQRMGGSKQARAMALSQVMQGKLSRRQAREMIAATGVGAAQFGDVNAQAANDYIKEQRQVTQKSRGVAMQETALVNQRLAVGAKVYEPVKTMEKVEMRLAGMAAPAGAEMGAFAARQLEKGIEVFKAVKEKEVPKTAGEAYRAAAGDFKALGEDILKVLNRIADFFTGGPEQPAYTRVKTTRGIGGEPIDLDAGQNE